MLQFFAGILTGLMFVAVVIGSATAIFCFSLAFFSLGMLWYLDQLAEEDNDNS